MAWTLDDLNKLKDAIATGAKRVKYADKEVEYNSFDDMIKAKNLIESELGLNSGQKRRSYPSYTKDL
jgi:hypothetical protein